MGTFRGGKRTRPVATALGGPRYGVHREYTAMISPNAVRERAKVNSGYEKKDCRGGHGSQLGIVIFYRGIAYAREYPANVPNGAGFHTNSG